MTAFFRQQSDAVHERLGQQLLDIASAVLPLAPTTVGADELQSLGAGRLSLFRFAQNHVSMGDGAFVVTLKVTAHDQEGLLLAITQRLANLHLSLIDASGNVVPNVRNGVNEAIISFTTSVDHWRQLLQLSCHLVLLEGVKTVVRIDA